MSCSAFPGPGDMHVYTFNPMAEFVHPVVTTHLDFEFKKFMKKHSKEYASGHELIRRKNAFRQNIRFIHSVNRQYKGSEFLTRHYAGFLPDICQLHSGH